MKIPNWTLLVMGLIVILGAWAIVRLVTPVPAPSPITLKRRLLPAGPREEVVVTRLKIAGNGLWVYQHADPGKVADVTLAIGAGHALPRYGGAKRDMTPDQLKTYADVLWAKGVRIQPWIYAYRSTGETWLTEIYQTLGDHPGFVGVMLNAEDERGGSMTDADWITDVAIGLRAQYAPGTLIGYSGHNMGRTHRKAGTMTFLKKVDYWSPQVYWGLNRTEPETFLNRGYGEWLALGKQLSWDPVIVPVGQAYWTEAKRPIVMKEGQLATFRQKTAGYPAISWYYYDQLKDKPAAIREIAGK